MPNLDDLLRLTSGEVLIQPYTANIDSPFSEYPYASFVQYTAEPNGILVPRFRKFLSYNDMIALLSEEQYDNLGEFETFTSSGNHAKLKVELYGRHAKIELPSKWVWQTE